MHRMVSEAPATASVPLAFAADGERWFGAMIPKRWARRAVTRNLIKRQIYSIVAEHEAALPAAAYLVRLRSAFPRQQFKSAASDTLRIAVRAEVEQLFDKAQGPREVTP